MWPGVSSLLGLILDDLTATSKLGQFWAMRDGSPGNSGNPGNEESVTYTSPGRPERPNPTLAAT